VSAAPAATGELERVVPRLRAARAGGVRWLLAHIGGDGEPAGAAEVNAWYRLPWALAVAGAREEAAAVLSWAEREALTPAGDLRPGAAQAPFTTGVATYPLSILAIGAWHLERFDTAGAIMDTLAAGYQHPETGGVFKERPELRATGRQDLISTAQAGLAALTTGRRAMADAAYDWIRRLHAAQPELPRRLYTATDDDGLVTDVPPELAFDLVTDLTAPRQAYFNPGIGAAFLGRYAMATGAGEARRLADALLALSEQATEAQFDHTDTVQVGKFAWGAAVLLEGGHDERYVRDLVRMGDWYADSQRPDGGWAPSAFQVPAPEDADVLWKTAEHVLHVTTMLTAIGGTDRAR
jgi:hypothetical protein